TRACAEHRHICGTVPGNVFGRASSLHWSMRALRWEMIAACSTAHISLSICSCKRWDGWEARQLTCTRRWQSDELSSRSQQLLPGADSRSRQRAAVRLPACAVVRLLDLYRVGERRALPGL